MIEVVKLFVFEGECAGNVSLFGITRSGVMAVIPAGAGDFKHSLVKLHDLEVHAVQCQCIALQYPCAVIVPAAAIIEDQHIAR